MKPYAEVIEAARVLYEHPHTNEALKVVLEKTYPELAESDNERIRKMCITAVNIAASADGGFLRSEASECLAWLEEQKDKNCLACDQHLKGYIAGRKVTEEEKQKDITPIVVSNADWDCQRAYSEGYQKGMAESNKQKPAEWSDEDKQKLNRIYEILGQAADDKGFLTSKRIIGDKEAIELQDFLKSLRPSWCY